MMDIRAFETELEKLRSGFSFDTTKLCGMYVAALARAEAAEAEALKQARHAAQARMRHANLLRRRGLEEPLTTVENEAEAAGLRARAEAIEAERDDANIAASLNKSRVEEMVDRLSFETKQRQDLASRVAELEAQLAAAGSRVIELEAAQDESYHAYLELKEEADSRGEPLREACRQNMILTARVAELEAQLAAAHLNPYNTAPLAEHVIVTLRTEGWRDEDGLWDWDDYGDWDVVGWQPLPPAPDTQEATTP